MFTTHEAIDLSKALVVKYTDASLAPLIREKLFLSIYKNCQHRAKPQEDASALAETVLKKITNLTKDGHIASGDIARSCLQTLQNFDHAAAVQYAAFHKRALE